MAFIRFIIAPEWFMELPDSAELTSKAVLEIYQYTSKDFRGSYVSKLVKMGSIPPPDKVTIRLKRNKLAWSVGYLKNYLKLPIELNKFKPVNS